MSYEPQGKIKPFIDAVRAEPQKVWSNEEIAKLLDVPQARVAAWLDYPVRNATVHRGRRDGHTVYSGTCFPPEAAFPRVVGSFVPAPMTAPRAGSDVAAPSRAPGSPPSAAPGGFCVGCARAICRDKGCLDGRLLHLASASPEPARSPSPAPAPAAAQDPAPEIDPRFAAAHFGNDLYVGERPGDGVVHASEAEADPEPQEVEEEEEQVEPDAWLSMRTGDMVLVGCEVDEDGRVTVPAELVARIKAQTVWSLAR